MANFKISGSKTLVGKLVDKMREVVNTESQAKVEKLITDLELATPIDTGYARSRWNLTTLDKPGLGYNVKYSSVLFNFLGKQYTISNDAEYIVFLNKGSSKQAPSYFIENTILSNGFTITETVSIRP